MEYLTDRRKTRKSILLPLLVICGLSVSMAFADTTGSANASGKEGKPLVNIRIAIGSSIMVATLENNPTARDFASQLPLTVTLRDFSAAEKISDALPKRLSEDNAPATDAGAVSDIAYYAPWNNIAFYRGNGPDASGVIKIAKIISGIEVLNQQGNVRATISLDN